MHDCVRVVYTAVYTARTWPCIRSPTHIHCPYTAADTARVHGPYTYTTVYVCTRAVPPRPATAHLGRPYVNVQIMVAVPLLLKCLTVTYFSLCECKIERIVVRNFLKSNTLKHFSLFQMTHNNANSILLKYYNNDHLTYTITTWCGNVIRIF